MQFGRSSEKVDIEISQLTLALENMEAGIERLHQPAGEIPAADLAVVQKPARRPLPEHLPRTTVAHETACACPA